MVVDYDYFYDGVENDYDYYVYILVVKVNVDDDVFSLD
jgi:hypothetical protein